MRIRHLLPAIAALVATGAVASGGILPIPDLLLNRYCANLKNSLTCARTIEAGELSARHGKRASRCRPHSLCINLAKSTITLEDQNLETDQSIQYSYIDFVTALKLHVVHAQHWEGNQFLAIHDETGRSASIIGYPVASPDQRRFAAVSMDMFAGFSPNGIELWRLESGRLYREARFDTDWGPSATSWRSTDNLVVTRNCENNDQPGTTKPCGSAELSHFHGRWTLGSPR